MGEEWLEANRKWWDERALLHPQTEMYAHQDLRPDWIVDELGPVDGLDVVHLQCHFGQDTLALADLGAGAVTGLDFSATAIDLARKLAVERGHADRADFVCADVRQAASALGGRRFDLVFTGIGAVCWLPSIAEWAEVVASLLRPGGRLYLADGHPWLWPFDWDGAVAYDYFEGEPVRSEGSGTYADMTLPTVNNVEYGFAHGLGEIVTAVIGAGLRVEYVHEFAETVYPFSAFAVESRPGYWRWPGREVPLLFSLSASAT
jgi:SAM-dependent methyltransferase